MHPSFTRNPWTIRQILVGTYTTFFRSPLDLTAAVLIIPVFWAVPRQILQSRMADGDLLGLDPDRPFHAFLFECLLTVWGCVWYAGQFAASLDVIAGRPVRWRAFLTGLARFPVLAVAALVISSPFLVIELLPSDPEGFFDDAAIMMATVIFVWLLIRTSFCFPLLIDARLPLSPAFSLSWLATRGWTLKLLGLFAVIALICAPLIIAEVLGREHAFLSLEIMGGFFTIATAQLYSVALALPGTREGSAQLAP